MKNVPQAQFRGGHIMMQPPMMSDNRLEFHNVGEVQNVGINLGFTDVGTVQRDVRVDVDPAQVGTQRSTILKLVVHANLNREAKTIFQLKRAKGRFLLEEGSIVQTRTDIGLECAIGREVVVERERGRQLLGGSRKPDTVDVDVMFERGSCQEFDAQIVTDEILGSDGGANTIADVCSASCKGAVTRFGDNRCDTETEGDIPLRLGGGGGRSKSCERECDECCFHDSVSNRINTIVLRRVAASAHDICQFAARFCGEKELKVMAMREDMQ